MAIEILFPCLDEAKEESAAVAPLTTSDAAPKPFALSNAAFEAKQEAAPAPTVERRLSPAIEKALDGGDVINVYTRSNFGFAFHEFWRNHLSSVDKKTTVLILGDARNNYNDPRAWCLRDIQSKAKNVVWLNPESPSAWGFGDSVMDRYVPYCDIVEECRNLRQLSRIVDQIVL